MSSEYHDTVSTKVTRQRDPIDAMITEYAARRANIIAPGDADIDEADRLATGRQAAVLEKRGGFPVTGVVADEKKEREERKKRRIRKKTLEAQADDGEEEK
jgi:hypothetical protein